MIPIPAGVRLWLATGHTDVRKGLGGLPLIVQETLKRDPHCGLLFVFRDRRAISLNACGATARVCTCSLNDLNATGFCAVDG
jgi:transposase